MYPMTVDKMLEVLGEIKAAGMGDMFIVISHGGGPPLPIEAIINPPIGTRERWGDYIMSEEEAQAAPDDTPQVICLQAPQMTPVGWLTREFQDRPK